MYLADTPVDNVVEGEILKETLESEFASALMTIINAMRKVGCHSG